MSLTAEIAHRSSTVNISLVRCRPHDDSCGPIEHSATHILVLPLRGVFVKHNGNRERVVADACHALFFGADEPYRVSHPVHGGDECLVVEPSREVLFDILATLDVRATDHPETLFRQTHVPLDARLIAIRRLFWHRLGRRIADLLEVEETALNLLTGTIRAASMSQSPSTPRWPRARSRYEEMVEATKITLAARPALDWTLDALAKRVYSSPFHLARTFRQFAGMPLHRYHLLARMAVALDEVLDSSRDLTTIGVDLGFSSHSHFTATFRRTFGITPSALRRQSNTRRLSEMSKILTAP